MNSPEKEENKEYTDPENSKKEQEQKTEKNDDELFPIKGYVILNLIFYAFCFFQVLIVHKAGGESEGLFFFFLTIALGFTIVSIFDCLYDRFRYRKKHSRNDSS